MLEGAGPSGNLKTLPSAEKTLVLATHSEQLAGMMGRKIISIKNGCITSIAEVA